MTISPFFTSSIFPNIHLYYKKGGKVNTIFVLLIACTLVYFFPQYKISFVYSMCKSVLSFFLQKVSSFISVVFFSLFILVLSFIIPSIVFHMVSSFSNIFLFLIEVVFAYHLISIPLYSDFMPADSHDKDKNSSTIIQAIVCFLDNLFIPCLCIALLGIPLALFFRAFSFCVKRIVFLQNHELNLFSKINNALLFLPSYIFVLSLFTTSAFLPFCNVKNGFTIFVSDKKKIEPNWLSRILAACFGLLCIEIPVSFLSNGLIITKSIGNTSRNITGEVLRGLVYLLYASSILILFLLLVCRIVVTWGVW